MTDYINAIEQGIDFTRFRSDSIGENTIDDALAVIASIQKNGVGIDIDVSEGLEHIYAIIKNAKNDSFFYHMQAFKYFKMRYELKSTDVSTIDRVSNRFYSDEIYGLEWPFMPKIDRNGVRHIIGEELQKFRDIAMAHGFKVAKERYDLNHFSYVLARRHMTDEEIRVATRATAKAKAATDPADKPKRKKHKLYHLIFSGETYINSRKYYAFKDAKGTTYATPVNKTTYEAFDAAESGEKFRLKGKHSGRIRTSPIDEYGVLTYVKEIATE